MSKHKRPFDQNLVDAINKLCWPLVNNNGIKVFLRNSARYESGAEHIAGKLHELKVRDIKAIPEGIRSYVRFIKDKDCQETYCYFINRKGEDDGFIKVAVKLYEHDKKKAYVKSIFIVYRIKKR